ncbi:MAG: tetratricopeptide repeat protein, partial [Lysobacterales bacterium]
MYRVFAGEIRGGEGDIKGAANEYLEAAMESDDPAIAMRATRVAIAAEAWLQASMAADRWAELAPTSIPARESAAMAMLATADYVGAEIHLLQLLVLSPDKDSAWSLISQLLVKSPSPEKAAKVLDRLLAEQGAEGSAAGYYARSQLAAKTGELAEAYQLARKAASLQPGDVEFLTWAGRLALNQGNKNEGLEYFRMAWEASPDDHDLTLAYADLLARDGQQDAARTLLDNTAQTPDVMLTRILFELGSKHVQAAFALYSEFQEMSFADARKKAFYLAQAAESLDRLQDALGFYEQVDEGEFYIPATARRAELMAMSGDLDGAEKTLATLRLNPDPTVVEQAWLAEA